MIVKPIATPEALFTEALRSPNNLELLEKVRLQANEILDGILSSNQFGPSDDELAQIDDAWLAACYDALAVEKLSENVEEEFYATAKNEESVGRAFSQALMTISREDIRRFEPGLACLPKIEPEEVQELLNTPSAKGGGSYSLPLAQIGLTPLSMFYATEAVSYLIERLEEQELLPTNSSILLKPDHVLVNYEYHEVLTWDLTVDEIRRLSVCNRETAIEIYRWLIQVGQYRPYLFSGFKCDPASGGFALVLSHNEMKFVNLYQRWGFEDTYVKFEKVTPFFWGALSGRQTAGETEG